MLFVWIFLTGCDIFSTPPEDSPPPVSETHMKLVWEIPYEPAGSGVNASPLLLGDSLVIMSAGNEMYAVEQNTGIIRWKYKESDVTCSQTESYSTDGIRIYTTQVEDVRAINISNGSLEWIRPLPEERGGFWTHSTHIGKDALLINGYRTTYSLNKSDGNILWSNYLNAHLGSPAVSGFSVLSSGAKAKYDSSGKDIGTIGTIYSLNIENGDTLWTAKLLGDGHFEKMINDDGIIYGGTYFTWSSGSFEARNATTGELQWAHFTQNTAWSYKDCIVVDDKIFVNSGLGNYVFAFNKYTGQLVWRTVLPGDPLQEKQCFYDGYIYITQGWKLYIIDATNGEVVYSLKPKGRELVTIAVGNGKVFVCGYPTLQCYEVYKP